MPSRPVKHRASALARREALLEAAILVVSERGLAGATHRAIAARAGLPPSTTTYFYASIDDLLVDALTHFTQQRVLEFKALSQQLVEGSSSLEEIATSFAEALSRRSVHEIAQFELYLDAGRPDSLVRDGITAVLDGFHEVAVTALAAAGIKRPHELAPIVVRLADGFALHAIARGEEIGDSAPLAQAFLQLVKAVNF